MTAVTTSAGLVVAAAATAVFVAFNAGVVALLRWCQRRDAGMRAQAEAAYADAMAGGGRGDENESGA